MNKRVIWTFITIISVVSISVYWATAYRTITWWDNSSYPIAANCLGIEFPPGSLILTLLGWVVIKLSFLQSKIFALNLFSGVIAAGTIAILFRLVYFLIEKTDSIKSRTYFSLFGISCGILIFAFSETLWTYSTQFTPYILTTFMTAILLYQLLKFWFEKDAQKTIYLVLFISFLFGIDFSIHRTNALMIPAFLGIILLKDYKLFFKPKILIAGISGLVIGLSFHFFKILMASAKPIVNFNNPDNLSRFYDYVSLKQYGGGFLTNVFTRKAPILSVQTYDYLQSFYNNFISFDSPLGAISLFTLVLAIAGVYFLFKANRKTALMLVMLFLLTTVLTIFYFNIPENFFRTFTRHYLPSFVIFTIFISYGASALLGIIKKDSLFSKIAIISLVLIITLLPVNQLLRNYKTLDGSNDSFAYDYADNILNSLRPEAVLFVTGDVFNPIFYLQQVEGKRKDVSVISLSLTNTKWYVKQLMSDHYNLPLTFSEDDISNLNYMKWSDSTVDISFEGELASFQLDSTNSIETVSILIQPTIADKYIRAQDWFVLEMLKENRWKRPIYFTQPDSWLKDYSRPEGMVWQLLPKSPADINEEILSRNLMKIYKYNGYTNQNRPLEFSSIGIGNNLWNQFMQLAILQKTAGDTTAAKVTIEFVKTKIPLERIAESEQSKERYKAILKMLEE